MSLVLDAATERPAAIYGAALNHRRLQAALAAEFEQAPYQRPPQAPVLFIKPRNTVSAAGAPIPFPADADAVYAGGALGVRIARDACRVSAADALSHVGGYAVVNEVSLAETSFYRPAIQAKCRDGFCPIGPEAGPDAINPQRVQVRTYINGALAETNDSADWLRGVAQLIADVSQFLTLYAGDLLIVATPPRNARLRPGDTVAVEIDGIGRLENIVAAEEDIQ